MWTCYKLSRHIKTARHIALFLAQTIPPPDITVIQDGRGQSGEEDIQ